MANQAGHSWRQERRLVRRSRSMLNLLAVPRPLTVQGVVERAAAHRGRRILIHECDTLSNHDDHASGLWIQFPDRDLVVVRRSLPDLLRAVTILHELAHVLLHSTSGREHGDLRALLPLLAEAGTLDRFPVVTAVRSRSCYDSVEEIEAETFARVALAEMVKIRPLVAAPEGHVQVTRTLNDLARALGAK